MDQFGWSFAVSSLALLLSRLFLLWLNPSSNDKIPTNKQPVDSEALIPAASGSITATATATDARLLARRYLPVYLLATTADWLQGAYVYDLYASYNFSHADIALLFVAGFLSSATVGTYVAGLADSLGRKRFSILYCVGYIAACGTKFIPNFTVLLIGRILSGVSTSLLFATFESWLLGEAHAHGLSETQLRTILGNAATGNGLSAIIAGLLAQAVAFLGGPIAPFIASAVFCVITWILIVLTWAENYGSESKQRDDWIIIWREIASSPTLILLGLTQSVFEAAMYSFVFLWTPTIQSATGDDDNDEELPLGLIFAGFMTSMMVGSTIFTAVAMKSSSSTATLSTAGLVGVFGIGVTVMNFPIWASQSSLLLLAAFNLFEVGVGAWWPLIGSARSSLIEDTHRSSILSAFRVPLNVMVGGTFLLIVKGVDSMMIWRGIWSLLGLGLVTSSILSRSVRGSGL